MLRLASEFKQRVQQAQKELKNAEQLLEETLETSAKIHAENAALKENITYCVICTEERAEVALFPCFHVCVCRNCWERQQEEDKSKGFVFSCCRGAPAEDNFRRQFSEDNSNVFEGQQQGHNSNGPPKAYGFPSTRAAEWKRVHLEKKVPLH